MKPLIFKISEKFKKKNSDFDGDNFSEKKQEILKDLDWKNENLKTESSINAGKK